MELFINGIVPSYSRESGNLAISEFISVDTGKVPLKKSQFLHINRVKIG